MGLFVGRNRKVRRCYGFDEIALVPGEVTINPNEVDISWELKGKRYETPILAAAMDGVVDTKFATAMGKMGGLAVLNLEGIQTRYEDPTEIYEKIAKSGPPNPSGSTSKTSGLPSQIGISGSNRPGNSTPVSR